MPDQEAGAAPAPSPREAAGRAMRQTTMGSSIRWEELSDARRRLWCENAEPVVLAGLRAAASAAVDQVARELYHLSHQRAETLTRWTMAEWDHGGGQHVNKAPWRDEARRILGLVESAYRDNGHIREDNP